MGPTSVKDKVLLLVVLLLFAPASLSAANFKIKPLIMSGSPAPGGETFVAFGIPQLIGGGDVAFGAFTTSGSGVYVKSETGIGLLYKYPSGTVTVSRRLPDPGSLGLTLETKPCTGVPGDRCAPWDPKQYDNYFLGNTDQLIAVCYRQISLGGSAYINDSLDILVGGVLVSGGSLVELTCPTMDFIRWQLNASFVGGGPIGITNSGAGLFFSALLSSGRQLTTALR